MVDKATRERESWVGPPPSKLVRTYEALGMGREKVVLLFPHFFHWEPVREEVLGYVVAILPTHVDVMSW